MQRRLPAGESIGGPLISDGRRERDRGEFALEEGSRR
jgi:hypothetical protein